MLPDDDDDDVDDDVKPLNKQSPAAYHYIV